jgi:hypothetical protein
MTSTKFGPRPRAAWPNANVTLWVRSRVDTRTGDFNGCSRRFTQLIIPDHDID